MSKELRIFDETGQTMTARVINSTSEAITTVSLTEISTKHYVGDFPAVSAGTYDVQYNNGTDDVGAETIIWDGTQVVNDEDLQAELTGIQNKLNTTTVDVDSPVTASGKIELVRGDDYVISNGREIAFNFTDAPDLTGGTVTLEITHGCWRPITTAGTVTSPNDNPTVTFELPSSTTSEMIYQYWDYKVVAVLSNGDITTLETGEVVVDD